MLICDVPEVSRVLQSLLFGGNVTVNTGEAFIVARDVVYHAL